MYKIFHNLKNDLTDFSSVLRIHTWVNQYKIIGKYLTEDTLLKDQGSTCRQIGLNPTILYAGT